MELQIIWFVLWGVLWAVYFMLDGFVFGTGILHNILPRTDGEKRVLINTIGPVWDGNEVWLITAGGATFAAFPTTYALMFSYLYTALLLLLFSLIVRGVSFEFRGKLEGEGWKKAWDVAIQVSSFLPALLFGVAFGNIFKGLPMDAAGYQGSFISLLNPYGLLTGVLFVLLFTVHGALWLSVKTVGDLSTRAKGIADKTWPALLVVAVAFLAYTKFATKLFDNYLANPLLFVVPLVAVAALLGIRLFSAKGATLAAFVSSCVTVLTVVATGVVGLFPNLIPSSLDPAYSLTIFNSSSSPYTLKIMTVVAFIFVPIVIAYKIWVYRIFRAPVTEAEVLEDKHAY
ncbi:cytochrome d ubiquinol oxidase subunit II [Geobacter hydrogenophilus]|uniref:Cytochrome c oxidase assembly protein n=1 Tax=Geobacter hydrogenophilus TaxID=40983 RepID=A0A9W6LBH3_9BACT|nr:cytochrome d ubiquinol oxidase subunit II [Geobacter hydrogenophilus]MBT0895363.1 cytochrome d ubiquinol oxidase subunit II [Geobacter hydrogenophilus]GLI36556.1 cytochrome c oxidase assembly protein [Geobacter hydrogenophilus]